MQVYRICRSRYQNDLSGSGAERVGGRWNSKGIPAIYTSESRALAMLELAVHLPIKIFHNDLVLLTIELPPDALIRKLAVSELPLDWQSLPTPNSTRNFGDKLLRSNSHLAFALPSVVIPAEFNYLIDPLHEQSRSIKIIDVAEVNFDKRLIG